MSAANQQQLNDFYEIIKILQPNKKTDNYKCNMAHCTRGAIYNTEEQCFIVHRKLRCACYILQTAPVQLLFQLSPTWKRSNFLRKQKKKKEKFFLSHVNHDGYTCNNIKNITRSVHVFLFITLQTTLPMIQKWTKVKK